MSGPNSLSVVLIDTNIFLRILVKENDRMFAECTEVMHLVARGDIVAYTSTLVLAEIHYVLSSLYKRSRQSITDALQAVLAFPKLSVVDDNKMVSAMGYYQATRVKFTDCVIASSEKVQKKIAVILSYDRDFDKLGIRRVEPRDFLKKSQKKSE